MPVIMELKRVPRTRPMYRAMVDEVRKEYEHLADDIIDDLYQMLGTWVNKPKVKKRIVVGRKRWAISLRVDGRTKSGQIFNYVDKGTGLWGKRHREYPIRPVHAKALAFTVPYNPKTLPPSYVTRLSRNVRAAGVPERVVTQFVLHTGIRPRRFTERLKRKYGNRKESKGFYRRTENAARRGLRRAGK